VGWGKVQYSVKALMEISYLIFDRKIEKAFLVLFSAKLVQTDAS
jgi:hypothetical protein